MRRGLDAALGALLALALAAALVIALHLSAGARELRVTLRAPEPYELAPRPRQPLAPVTVGPPSLLGRLDAAAGQPDRADPGLWLRTWQVTYGRRWERQVTVPVLAGPFDPEGKPWPCAVAVRFSPRFFDDDKPGGEDVEAVVDRMVRAQFPFSVMGLHLAAVASTTLHVRPVEGGLSVTGDVLLADSKRDPTDFALDAKIAVGEKDGDLTARIERLHVAWRGNTRRDPLVELAAMFLDVDAQARRIVGEKLGAALAILRLPKEPISIFPDRPGDRFTLRLCDAPDAHPDGLTVRLRVVATLAEPRFAPAIPGPPHLEDRPVLPPPGAGAPPAGAGAPPAGAGAPPAGAGAPPAGAGAPPPTFEAVASAAAVQQALYAAWQGGEMAAWGRDPRTREALARQLQDRLAFDLGDVTPLLPPVVLPEGAPGALRVRFGALEVGHTGARRVLVHGDVLAGARVADGALGLSGTLSDLRMTCVEGAPGELRLTPCFSDVVPALRDSGVTGEGLPLDLALPGRLLRLNLVLGTDLVLRGLSGEVGGSPPQLRLRGEARLVKRGKP
jgi:hypothetical protein